MTQYKDLKENEKKIFERIEGIFLNHNIRRTTFVKILLVLVNKYRFQDKKPVKTKKGKCPRCSSKDWVYVLTSKTLIECLDCGHQWRQIK